MSFFRVDEGGGITRSRPRALPAGPSAAHSAAPSAPRKPAPKPGQRPAPAAQAAAKKGGIELDLSPDSEDGDFEKF